MRPLDWLLLLLLSVLWGAAFFFIAVALPEVPPFSLVLARVAIAALVLVPIILLVGLGLPRTLRAWRDYAVLAILNNLLPFSLIAYGQTRIGSGLASVLIATTPLFTVLALRLLAGEPLTRAKLGGVLLGIAGVAVLTGAGGLGAGSPAAAGVLCVLGAALCYALSAFWMRRVREMPPLVSAVSQLVCSSILLLPIAALADRFWELPPPGFPAAASMLALAVLSTALAYLVFFRLGATAGPANAMLVTLLIPVTGTGLGALVLGEHLAAHQIAGALVIASGLVVIDGRLAGWLSGRRLQAA